MSRSFDVMVAGHLCLDIIPAFPAGQAAPDLDHLLPPGSLVTVGPAAVSTGGAVSNTGIALRKLGNRVCFSARVGDDAFGSVVVRLMERSGGRQGIRAVAPAVTSYTVVIAPAGRDRCFLHHPGANDEFCADDVDGDLLCRSRLFHFGYPPIMRRMYADGGAELKKLFRRAKQAGCVTSCDMVAVDPGSDAARAPWKKILAGILPSVDLFLPSFEEAVCLLDPEGFFRQKRAGENLIWASPPDRYAGVASCLLEMGAQVVVLKAADRGIYLRTSPEVRFPPESGVRPENAAAWAGRELWCPALRADEIASATGAGDACVAGFLTAFLKGLGPEECLRYAAIVGWENLHALDATTGIRTWEETVALFHAEMPVNDPELAISGWEWSAGKGVWVGPHDAAG